MRKSWMVLAVLLAGEVSAEDLAIQSFETDGTITFNEISNAESYRVEWSSGAGGPWTNFTGVYGVWLDNIPASGSGIVTASVPTLYRVVATVTRPPAPIGMVLIPGGTNSGTDPDEGGYSLTAESFYMDRYEVTKALWDEVKTWYGGNEYTYDNLGSGKASDHPVQRVNWLDCIKWCNARSEKEGRAPVYYTDAGLTQVYRAGQVWEPYLDSSADGYRLPTLLQWEYAARGGVPGQRFPWGTDTIQHARADYFSDSRYSYDTSPTRGFHPDWDGDGMYPYTSRVGTFAAGKNGYGLYDMAGNVWEWCYDWEPDSVGSFRVLRGGGWGTYATFCRVAFRASLYPDIGESNVGFRTVLPADRP